MKVFISHTATDGDLARELASSLSAAGLEVWDSELETGAGENVPLRIGKALAEANAMIVLLSPAAMQSDWMRREWEYALGARQYDGRLVPVVVRPTEAIPWILRELAPVVLYENPRRAKNRIVKRMRELAGEPSK